MSISVKYQQLTMIKEMALYFTDNAVEDTYNI